MKKKIKAAPIIFIVTFLLALACLIVSMFRTDAYNKVRHQESYSGSSLFSPADSSEEGVFVNASARDSTWTKCFDLNNEGLTEHNYQAYTYDVTITDNTPDEVSDYTFRLEFGTKVFLSSAWNGKLEIHQNVADSFDAMNTDRVYRKKLSKEKIISELENNKGLQFDPKIADVMLELLNDNAIKIE